MFTANSRHEAHLLWRSATLILSFPFVACGSASAMSRPAPTHAAPPAVVSTPTLDAAPLAAQPTYPSSPAAIGGGGYSEGYQLGYRNGSILTERVKQRTLGENGCSALAQFEQALIVVTRSIRPPAQASLSSTRGFYRGYLDAIRSSTRDARSECDQWSYTQGDFAGALYGSFLCQLHGSGVELTSEYSFEPLYAGWSGGSSAVTQGCGASLTQSLRTCSSWDWAQTAQVELAVGQACRDTGFAEAE